MMNMMIIIVEEMMDAIKVANNNGPTIKLP